MASSVKGDFAGTVVFDPRIHVHGWLRERLSAWRSVPIGDVIGRDVIESSRLIVTDWHLFAKMGHVRNLLLEARGRTIVLVGFANEPVGRPGLQTLRHFAGEVVVLRSAVDKWIEGLLVPVKKIEPVNFADAIQAITAAPAVDMNVAEVHLREARAYMRANDDQGAFLAAARALSIAPDEPGIVAGVARLLALMGRSDEGQQLCRRFLVMRPDDASVRRALSELQPSGI